MKGTQWYTRPYKGTSRGCLRATPRLAPSRVQRPCMVDRNYRIRPLAPVTSDSQICVPEKRFQMSCMTGLVCTIDKTPRNRTTDERQDVARGAAPRLHKNSRTFAALHLWKRRPCKPGAKTPFLRRPWNFAVVISQFFDNNGPRVGYIITLLTHC